MAHYLNLPNELKDAINMHLSQADLSRLSRTSKAFRTFFLPLVYKRISLTWTGCRPAQQSPNLSSLLCHLLSNKELAPCVQELRFSAKNYRGEYIIIPKQLLNGTRSFLSRSDRKVLEEALDKLELEEIVKWKRAIFEEGNLDALIALTIFQCPNLKVLEMSVDFLSDNPFLAEMLQLCVTRSPDHQNCRFSKLESVKLAKGNPHWGHEETRDYIMLSLSTFVPLFYLPSLRELSAPLPDREKERLPSDSALNVWPTATPPTSNLRILHLHRALVCPATLEYILANMPHLTSLTYDYWCDAQAGDILHCDELRATLQHVRATLTHLTVSLYPWSAEEHDIGADCFVEGALAPLTDFSRLTFLEISFAVLLGWGYDFENEVSYTAEASAKLPSVLPPALEELVIRDDCYFYCGMEWTEHEVVAAVTMWIVDGKWRTSTPRLKKVGLGVLQPYSVWDAPMRESVRKLCEKEGLECWFAVVAP